MFASKAKSMYTLSNCHNSSPRGPGIRNEQVYRKPASVQKEFILELSEDVDRATAKAKKE